MREGVQDLFANMWLEVETTKCCLFGSWKWTHSLKYLYVYVLVSIMCCQNPCSFGSFSRCLVSKSGSSLSGTSMCLTQPFILSLSLSLSLTKPERERERWWKNLLYTFPYVLESKEGAFAAGLTLRKMAKGGCRWKTKTKWDTHTHTPTKILLPMEFIVISSLTFCFFHLTLLCYCFYGAQFSIL